MAQMDKAYDPAAIEQRWYERWESAGAFAPTGEGEPFSITLPPPNVTGILHMGHALDHTLEDIPVRFHRMRGRRSLWVPGTDHAGIATQNVVDRALKKDGESREEIGREAFVERVWEWVDTYGGIIKNQSSPHARLRSVDLKSVRWTAGFWADRFKQCREVTLPRLYELAADSEKTHVLENFKIAAGLTEGEAFGCYWHDAWAYKWLEAASYVQTMTLINF